MFWKIGTRYKSYQFILAIELELYWNVILTTFTLIFWTFKVAFILEQCYNIIKFEIKMKKVVHVFLQMKMNTSSDL